MAKQVGGSSMKVGASRLTDQASEWGMRICKEV